MLSWLWVAEAYKKVGKSLPVNIVICMEGQEESGSEGLEELVKKEAKQYFKNVDYWCISDNYWLGPNHPCLTYGLRGLSYFTLEVEGASKDLHSGVFGGSVGEAMTDLIHLMSKLVDTKGKILVPGISDRVRPVTEDEKKLYGPIEFDLSQFQKDAGAKGLLWTTKEDVKKNVG